MFEKLEDIAAKFERLDQQLQDPSVTDNPKQYQAIAKEHGSLRELMVCYRDYKNIAQQIEDNKSLLKESDPELRTLAQAELPGLEEKQEQLEQELKVLLLPKDPNDDKDIILEIRAGTGGDEAGLFAADLLRMYQRYCEKQGWKLAIMDSSETGIGGFKEVIANVSGDQVYSTLKYESGIHRVQRVPETESQGRVHTSAVTVAVMPEAEDVDLHIRPEDIEFEAFRASGAGGQHVNTTDSAVRLTYKPTGLAVVCREERSQMKNRDKAMKLLKSRLLAAEQEKQAAERSASRKIMVGSGDRSEKIRTYNYPQNRVTDHRIGLTLKKLDQVMDGDLDEIITSLRTHYQAELLKTSNAA